MFKRIKYFIQRGKRGYSDEDTWDFHSYLCDILIPVLRNLSKNKMSCPVEFWDKENKNDECYKWSEILESMAQGFEAAQMICNMQYYKMTKTTFGGSTGLTREIDEEKMKLLTEKYEKGIELFCKHFLSLWD